jgi:TonB family protein
MNATVHSAFEPTAKDVRGMNMALTVSLVVHALLLATLFVSKSWLQEEPKPRMVITLGGTTGPKTTGMSELGGRTVEQVAPPPKRLEPARAPEPDRPKAPTATRTPPKMVTETPKPQTITERPPVTGRQVQRGTATADTGANSPGSGLASGENGGGAPLTDLKDFPAWYIEQLKAQVDQAWTPRKRQSARGTNIIRFTVLRDGRIVDIDLEKSSGITILDRASRSAVAETKLPPLPPEYKGDSLRVNITFPYTGE